MEETTNVLGGQAPIDFVVADCADPKGIPQLEDQRGTFDVVMANFLFNYARTEEEMAGMWRNVSGFLRPGGVFIATTQTFADGGRPECVRRRKYGLVVEDLEVGEGVEGGKGCKRQRLEFGWGDGRENVRFESFMLLDKEVWERTAKQAGMRGLKFHRFERSDVPEVVKTPDGERRREDVYWDELLEQPFNWLMTARRDR